MKDKKLEQPTIRYMMLDCNPNFFLQNFFYKTSEKVGAYNTFVICIGTYLLFSIYFYQIKFEYMPSYCVFFAEIGTITFFKIPQSSSRQDHLGKCDPWP